MVAGTRGVRTSPEATPLSVLLIPSASPGRSGIMPPCACRPPGWSPGGAGDVGSVRPPSFSDPRPALFPGAPQGPAPAEIPVHGRFDPAHQQDRPADLPAVRAPRLRARAEARRADGALRRHGDEPERRAEAPAREARPDASRERREAR